MNHLHNALLKLGSLSEHLKTHQEVLQHMLECASLSPGTKEVIQSTVRANRKMLDILDSCRFSLREHEAQLIPVSVVVGQMQPPSEDG